MTTHASQADDQVLVRYLLGTLPEDAAERLDEASIGDDEFVARLRVVEQDLIDDYVRHSLRQDTAARFEACYLASPRRRLRVRAAEVFLAAVDGAAVQADAERKPPAGSRFRWQLAAAAILIVATGTVYFETIPRTKPDSPATAPVARNESSRDNRDAAMSPAPLNRPSATEPAHGLSPARTRRILNENAGPMPSIALVLPPQRRTVGDIPTLAAPPADQPVAFELQLESSASLEYRVTLKDPVSQRAVWRSGFLRPRSATDVTSIAVVVPAGLLRSQRYWFEVNGGQGRTSGEPIGTYVFQVLEP